MTKYIIIGFLLNIGILFVLWWLGLFTFLQLACVYLIWLGGLIIGAVGMYVRLKPPKGITLVEVKRWSEPTHGSGRQRVRQFFGLEQHPGEVQHIIWNWIIRRGSGRPPSSPEEMNVECKRLADMMKYKDEYDCTWQEVYQQFDVSEKWRRYWQKKCKSNPP